MWIVFDESEIVSLLARGAHRSEVARGIHLSIVNRSFSLLKRVGNDDDILFAGGVAYNKCIVEILEKQLNKMVLPNDPQIAGTLGAAISGY